MEWRRSQEINLFTLFFCKDKVYNQRSFCLLRKYAVKLKTLSSRTTNSSLRWIDTFKAFLSRENSVLLAKSLSFLVTKSLQSGRKAMTWSYLEILSKRHITESMRTIRASIENKTPFTLASYNLWIKMTGFWKLKRCFLGPKRLKKYPFSVGNSSSFLKIAF